MTPTTAQLQHSITDSGLPSSTRALDRLFVGLDIPQPNELSGVFRGRLLAVRALDGVSAGLRLVLVGLLGVFLSPLLRHHMGINRGSSRLLASLVKWGSFRLDVASSFNDGEPLLRLGYDDPDNLPGVRSRVDQLRKLPDGRFLVRACIQRANGLAPVGFYVLESAQT